MKFNKATSVFHNYYSYVVNNNVYFAVFYKNVSSLLAIRNIAISFLWCDNFLSVTIKE